MNNNRPEFLPVFESCHCEDDYPKGRVVFFGDSDISHWDIAKCFPSLGAMRCGAGGCGIKDCALYVDRLIQKYAPKAVVLVAGENDMCGGVSHQDAFKDFQTVVERLLRLDEVHVIYISTKPEPVTVAVHREYQRYDQLIRALAVSDGFERLIFIDSFTPMADMTKSDRKRLFVKDGLHLSAEGYALWTSWVNEALLKVGIGDVPGHDQ